MKLNYDDVVIVPDISTDIESRKSCDCKTKDGKFPIFVAPMDTVVNLDNWKIFLQNGINVVIPRNIDLQRRMEIMLEYSTHRYNTPFIAMSLEEARESFTGKNIVIQRKSSVKVKYRICIDVANGHMMSEINLIKSIKDKWGDRVEIMGGNIANPKTYELYEKAGCDYLRCGIGHGGGCLTTSNTGVTYPLFSLLLETYNIKKSINGKCKIIADGGIKGYRDVQKALLYADYVMMGSIFNKAIESAGRTTYGNFYWNIRGKRIFRPLKSLLYYGREVPKERYPKVIELIKENKLTVWKEFYGMSTKKAQKNILEGNGKSAENLKTSEGLVTYQKVEYSIAGWMRNEMDYLRSAMSYTNSHNLEEYKDSEWVRVDAIKFNK
jgi:IMP dehydrogenase/GMP reductase